MYPNLHYILRLSKLLDSNRRVRIANTFVCHHSRLKYCDFGKPRSCSHLEEWRMYTGRGALVPMPTGKTHRLCNTFSNLMMRVTDVIFFPLQLLKTMDVTGHWHKGINEHEIEVNGRKYRAGWPATAAIVLGALTFGARSSLPWKPARTGPLIVLVSVCAYVACFRRDE